MARQFFREAGQSLDAFIVFYEKNMERYPEEFCFRQQLVYLYLEEREIAKARQLVEDFIELWPDYSSEAEEVLKHLSRVEEFLKQLEQLEDEL